MTPKLSALLSATDKYCSKKIAHVAVPKKPTPKTQNFGSGALNQLLIPPNLLLVYAILLESVPPERNKFFLVKASCFVYDIFLLERSPRIRWKCKKGFEGEEPRFVVCHEFRFFVCE